MSEIDQSCVNVKKRKNFHVYFIFEQHFTSKKYTYNIIQIEPNNGYYTIPLNTYYNHTNRNINHQSIKISLLLF